VEVLVRVAVAREVLLDMRHILPVHLPREERREERVSTGGTERRGGMAP
jgi:hypothetical protein